MLKFSYFTSVTEESAILENEPAETGALMEGNSPAAGEILMDEETPADRDFPMDGELPGTGEAAMEEELPGSDETAMEDDVPASDNAITDGDVPEETSPSGENMEAETKTGNDGEMELQPGDTEEATAAPRRRKAKTAPAAKPEPPVRKAAPSTILTLNADSEVETPESREDTIWHELQNAYRTRKILTGTLGGIEKMDGGGTIAVIYYKDMRVVIPL